ncbi:DUF3598 domain-containing protein [Sphingomonas antarctica]|uniref:hypothetical protein n=1 Tax=Sphingomonas antarctica TaxID=2040274 RepID=UPI0039E90DD7
MTSFADAMPEMLRHEGEWEGVYRHVDRDFTLIDEHGMWTRCEFPRVGPYAYIQHNRLTWADGRTEERSFPGIYRDGLLWWDTDRFSGFGWEMHGVVMLHLDRKDVPDAHFTEMIELSADGNSRSRTWQWFQDGLPVRRTLCDEWRTS